MTSIIRHLAAVIIVSVATYGVIGNAVPMHHMAGGTTGGPLPNSSSATTLVIGN